MWQVCKLLLSSIYPLQNRLYWLYSDATMQPQTTPTSTQTACFGKILPSFSIRFTKTNLTSLSAATAPENKYTDPKTAESAMRSSSEKQVVDSGRVEKGLEIEYWWVVRVSICPLLYLSLSCLPCVYSRFLDPRKFKRRGGTTPGGASSSKKK